MLCKQQQQPWQQQTFLWPLSSFSRCSNYGIPPSESINCVSFSTNSNIPYHSWWFQFMYFRTFSRLSSFYHNFYWVLSSFIFRPSLHMSIPTNYSLPKLFFIPIDFSSLPDFWAQNSFIQRQSIHAQCIVIPVLSTMFTSSIYIAHILMIQKYWFDTARLYKVSLWQIMECFCASSYHQVVPTHSRLNLFLI